MRACAAATAAAWPSFAAQANLEVFYARLDVDDACRPLPGHRLGQDAKRAEKQLAKARTKDSLQALAEADPRGRRRAAHQRRPAR